LSASDKLHNLLEEFMIYLSVERGLSVHTRERPIGGTTCAILPFCGGRRGILPG